MFLFGNYQVIIREEIMTKKESVKHQYPCPLWLEERSCSECRQIADELSYMDSEERNAYREDLRKMENGELHEKRQ